MLHFPLCASDRLTIERVREAMGRERGERVQRAREGMAPYPRPLYSSAAHSAREAGVLLLLYPIQGALHLPLTVRTAGLHDHSGQIAFPGGRREKGDASLQATALREAQEEIGVMPDELEMLGPLTPLYIPPSNYLIHPFVAYLPRRPSFRPDPAEVAELLEVPLGLLLDPATRREGDAADFYPPERVLPGMRVPFYAVGGRKVWGATAIVLAELLALIMEVKNE